MAQGRHRHSSESSRVIKRVVAASEYEGCGLGCQITNGRCEVGHLTWHLPSGCLELHDVYNIALYIAYYNDKSKGMKRVQMYMYTVSHAETQAQPAQSRIIMGKNKCARPGVYSASDHYAATMFSRICSLAHLVLRLEVGHMTEKKWGHTSLGQI